VRHGLRKEPLSRAIAQEGPKLLQEIIPKDSEEKGRRNITWKLFLGLAGSVIDSIMTKVEALQTSFYLRFSCTCQLRNIKNGKVMLFHTNLGGSPTLLTDRKGDRGTRWSYWCNRLVAPQDCGLSCCLACGTPVGSDSRSGRRGCGLLSPEVVDYGRTYCRDG